jgi:hypothetical protein
MQNWRMQSMSLEKKIVETMNMMSAKIENWRNEMNKELKQGRKPTTGRYDTREELEAMIAMYRMKGWETRRIALRCGCSKGTVNTIMKNQREISRE